MTNIISWLEAQIYCDIWYLCQKRRQIIYIGRYLLYMEKKDEMDLYIERGNPAYGLIKYAKREHNLSYIGQYWIHNQVMN